MNEKIVNCPACKSSDLQVLEHIWTDDIVKLYKTHNINVADHFPGISKISYIKCSSCDLKFFSPRVCGSEIFYNQLQNQDWYFLHQDKTEFEFASSYVSDKNNVLDVGSGRGVWRKYLPKETFYQGIEFSDKAIDLAQRDGINVIKEPVGNHSEKFRGFYDVVGVFQVLEHIDDIETFMRACIECLKPGGKLIIAVPNNEGFIKNLTNNWLNIPPHHVNHWNENSLTKLTGSFSMKTVEVFKEKVTPVHRLLFYNVHVASTLNKKFRRKKRLVDNSIFYKLTNKAALWLSKVFYRSSDLHAASDGHTIIIVMEK